MTAAVFQSRDEAFAGGLAFAMHVLFLVLLVFGVSWQHKPVETAAVVDLWRDLPSAGAPKVEVAPPAPIKPEPPPPQPKVEAKPPPKPEPAKVALSFKGEDLVGPQAPIVLEILQQQGLKILQKP